MELIGTFNNSIFSELLLVVKNNLFCMLIFLSLGRKLLGFLPNSLEYPWLHSRIFVFVFA